VEKKIISSNFFVIIPYKNAAGIWFMVYSKKKL
jgi:hypothetical protein